MELSILEAANALGWPVYEVCAGRQCLGIFKLGGEDELLFTSDVPLNAEQLIAIADKLRTLKDSL